MIKIICVRKGGGGAGEGARSGKSFLLACLIEVGFLVFCNFNPNDAPRSV